MYVLLQLWHGKTRQLKESMGLHMQGGQLYEHSDNNQIMTQIT